MTAVVDYGVGNLFSLTCSLAKIGENAVVTGDRSVIEQADRIILPGVGAFADAAGKLFASGLAPVLQEASVRGVPLLGICLGMQLLFEKSFEYGEHRGLGLLKGEIVPIPGSELGLKVPHMGWNGLDIVREHPLLSGVRPGDCVYFVHSFYAAGCDESVIATAGYGMPLTAAVAQGPVMGCQFHPEKSGDMGLAILRAFAAMKEGTTC